MKNLKMSIAVMLLLAVSFTNAQEKEKMNHKHGEMEMDHWILSELDSQLIFEKESINKWLKAYENSFIRL